MKCPNNHTCSGIDLVMTERQGVEIDYCPQCRGVWLDRGELDKLMEKAAAQSVPLAQAPQQPASYPPGVYPPHRAPKGRDFEDSDFNPHRGYAGGYKRKKSWLSEIFD